jgi:hypothetical protein
MRLIVTYRGITVFRNTTPGCALRWSARGYGAADTLDAMRQLIREGQS